MGNPSNNQREIETDVVRRVVDAVRRSDPPSDSSECHKHDSRIIKLEVKQDEHSSKLIKLDEKAEEHERRLAQGDVGFSEVRKDIHALTAAVREAIAQYKIAGSVNWWHVVLISAINWGIPVAIVALILGVVKTGALGVHP